MTAALKLTFIYSYSLIARYIQFEFMAPCAYVIPTIGHYFALIFQNSSHWGLRGLLFILNNKRLKGFDLVYAV